MIFNRGREGEATRNMPVQVADLTKIHNIFTNEWDNWLDGAPEEYKCSGFFMNHAPVGITLLYGQNEVISTAPDTIPIQRETWNRDHSFSNIMDFTFALASHAS